jgi:hypothetical protein
MLRKLAVSRNNKNKKSGQQPSFEDELKTWEGLKICAWSWVSSSHTWRRKAHPARTSPQWSRLCTPVPVKEIARGSNVKNGRTNIPISIWKRNQNFWYSSQISLVENILFQFCPESALLGKIERITFDKTNRERKQWFFVSFLLDIGTFVERLLLYCFEIAR